MEVCENEGFDPGQMLGESQSPMEETQLCNVIVSFSIASVMSSYHPAGPL